MTAWDGGITKAQVKALGDNRYFHYFDCSDDIMGVYTCKNCTL